MLSGSISVEDKNVINQLVETNLVQFFRLEEVYFNASSCFFFSTESIELNYIHSTKEFRVTAKKLVPNASSKLVYIPAERALITALPNIGKYAVQHDQLLNFLYDWFDFRKKYQKGLEFPNMNLGFKYVFDSEKDKDVLSLENGENLSFSNASSGSQSLVPLVLFIDYLTHKMYEEKQTLSPELRERLIKKLEHSEISQDVEQIDWIKQFIESKIYGFSQLFIEEPELSLFPSTQRDLINYLFGALCDTERKHTLYLSTHSSFVLYVINNLVFANKLNERGKRLEKKYPEFKSDELTVYSIENGGLSSLLDEDGLIHENYFDNTMKGIMDDYR